MKAFQTTLLAAAIVLGAGACTAHADEPSTKRTLGQTIDDATITAGIKTKLLADERTQGFDINVTTKSGIVTLEGGADSLDAKRAAGDIARQAEGVVMIQNKLIVAAPHSEARQDANTATASGEVREAMDESGDGIDDGWITTKVKAQLLADEMVKGTMINVDTHANVVTLTGTAQSAAARTKAIELAASTKGVRSVVADQLLVAR
jgi:hyperosmotically inducible periplasmic protein